MKNITLSISEENHENLKEEANKSGLVNELLNTHFAKQKLPAFTLEQLKELREIAIAKESMEKKAEAIANGCS